MIGGACSARYFETQTFSMKIKSGDTVLLTGASGGLGKYMALAFAELKVRQALVAHPGSSLKELQKTVEKRGGEAVVFVCDLRDAAQRKQLLQDVRRQFGSIDILINNAGVEFTSAFHEMSEENIYGTLRVNLEAPIGFDTDGFARNA